MMRNKKLLIAAVFLTIAITAVAQESCCPWKQDLRQCPTGLPSVAGVRLNIVKESVATDDRLPSVAGVQNIVKKPAAKDGRLPPQTKAKMIAVGASNILDTYLSPEKYKGTEVRYISHNTRPLRRAHLSSIVMHQGQFSYVSNRADNNNELEGAYNFLYCLRYNWQITPAFKVEAGGGIEADIGFLYNTRNGNNPAQLRLSASLTPSFAATYDLAIKSCDLRIKYEGTAPLAGLMFSPNYEQSYYEIFNRGNYDRNIVPTTIVSTPSYRQMVTLDIRPSAKWRSTWLRAGYLGDYQQAKVNNLRYHQLSHMFVLGITKYL